MNKLMWLVLTRVKGINYPNHGMDHGGIVEVTMHAPEGFEVSTSNGHKGLPILT